MYRTAVVSALFPLLLLVCRRIWHVDAEGRVSTPLNFTATISYINFLNHSDQASAATVAKPYTLNTTFVWRLSARSGRQ